MSSMYQIQEGATQTYEQWEAKCKAIGGRLASINDAMEQKMAEDALKRAKVNGEGALTATKRIAPNADIFVNGDGTPVCYS